MAQEIDPVLKAKIIQARRMEPVDRMRRLAKATAALFEAIDPLTLQERILLLEDVLEVLDPSTEPPTEG